MYVKLLRKAPLERFSTEAGIKQYVGNGLILALDIAMGGDIIKSILAPTGSDILALAVIVAIRIALSWSLSRENKGNQSLEGK